MKAGHVHVLDYVEAHFPDEWTDLIYFTPICASGGSIPVADWCEQRGLLDKSGRAIMEAAKNGHIEFMRWYWGNFCHSCWQTFDRCALETTVSRGHFECAKFLVAINYSQATSEALVCAASNGNLEIVQWLISLLVKEPDADAPGGEELRKWMGYEESDDETEPHTNDGEPVVESVEMLARTHWAKLESLNNAMDSAATSGHLEVVKWIHALGWTKFHPLTIRDAAKNGHTQMVQFLLKHATDNDIEGATFEAASHGHLRTIKCLLSHCPLERKKCEYLADRARACNHNQVAKWIMTFGVKQDRANK